MAQPRKRKTASQSTTPDAAIWGRLAHVLERLEARLNAPAPASPFSFPPPPPPLPAGLAYGYGSGSYEPPPPPPAPDPAQECCEQIRQVLLNAPSGSMLTTEDGLLVAIPPPNYLATWRFDPQRPGGAPFWDRDPAPEE